ncbi:MAG: M42 family metallopeptidase [Candidatus Altiarchaeota archaeon]
MDLLERLCRAHAVSGFERDVSKIMFDELKKSCEQAEIDDFGDVIAKKGEGKNKVMLAAHIDEIGLMVKYINKEGFIHFVKIGGIDDSIILGQKVVVKTQKGDVTGIIGAKPIHLKKPEERKKLTKHSEMFVDIGAKSDKQAKKIVEIGDPIGFAPCFGELFSNNFFGKALDNRLGCYVLLKVMEKLPKKLGCEVYAVGTVQEEVGLKGARVSAFKLDPDYAIAIDTTVAGGTPGIKEQESNLKLEGGPAITITEASGRGLISHPKIKDLLINTAKKNKIPYQIDVIEGGMTDGAVISLSREGIPTGVVSIPTRYLHCPIGVFNKKDVDNAVKLLVAAVKKVK